MIVAESDLGGYTVAALIGAAFVVGSIALFVGFVLNAIILVPVYVWQWARKRWRPSGG